MKTAPSRSPSRRSSPPPPRMSHRSPGFRRGRSPERRRRDSQSGGSRLSPPPRSRERREFRPSPRSQPPSEFAIPRRSRSPMREPKRRSFSPKRKSPKREREHRDPERERSSRPVSRKRSRSKTPPVTVGSSIREGAPRLGPYSGPSDGPSTSRGYPVPDSYASVEPVMEVEHSSRNISSIADRFPIASRGSYEDDRGERAVFHGPSSEINFSELSKIAVDVRNDRPVFRGPDGTGYNVNELKKFTMKFKNVTVSQPGTGERSVLNPQDVVIVRRPDISHDGEYPSEHTRRVSRDHYDEHRSPSPKRRHRSPWEQDDPNNFNHRRNKSEGCRPIFARDEIIQANEKSKYEPGPSHEHRSISTNEQQRVVSIYNHVPHTQSSGGPRYESPTRYTSSHQPSSYYTDRDRRSSSREYVRPRDYERSRGSGYEPREKSRDRFERRDDLRHDLELRRRDDSRCPAYSETVRTYEKGREYRGESDRGSDLRMRIHEKRTDRHDDRDMGHHPSMERHGMDRDRERRVIQPSSPGDRRRGPMDGGYGHRGEGDRKMRGDMRMHSNTRGGPGGRRNDMPERFHQDGEFVPRPERFHGSKPWDANPEYVPKGRAYFEHDNRDEMRMPNRGRGMSGPRGYMRGRGMMRGRPFRGAGQARGYYMGGRGAGRRGGYSPRIKQSSPHWEHDLFDNAPPDHGNNGFGK